MSKPVKCPFYRDSQGLTVNRGHCHLCGAQTVCGGNVEFCENPDVLRRQLSERRRKEAPNDREDRPQKKKSSHYKVLVVDDEESMRKLIVTLLSQQGHQCITASHGIEALNKMKQEKADAVITDIVMPEMDGIALTKEILALYPKLPILVMTGHGKEYPAEAAITAGARDFIGKPFSIEEFMLRLNKLMRDAEILREIEAKQKEMVFHLSRKSSEEVTTLKREIEDLKSKLYAYSGSLR